MSLFDEIILEYVHQVLAKIKCMLNIGDQIVKSILQVNMCTSCSTLMHIKIVYPILFKFTHIYLYNVFSRYC